MLPIGLHWENVAQPCKALEGKTVVPASVKRDLGFCGLGWEVGGKVGRCGVVFWVDGGRGG